ncbi:MAG: hypothetical protein M3O70_01735, partial [Actinomycetota bacterium]|nr:hypothetical protein [Actinomycetota bacterium]
MAADPEIDAPCGQISGTPARYEAIVTTSWLGRAFASVPADHWLRRNPGRFTRRPGAAQFAWSTREPDD